MPGACAGLRVLELSHGIAGSMAGMILADFGAEVIRVEPPEGDPGWDEPAALLLHRGKQSIELDLGSPEGRAHLRRLVPGIDVVIDEIGPHQAEDTEIGYDALAAINPTLVYCSITAWGRSGTFVDVKPDDTLVMAKAGIFRDQPGWEQDGTRPIYRSAKDPSYFSAMLAVQGILAALRARDLTGRGQRVDTNMLKALTCRQNPQVRWILRDGEELPPDGATTKTVPDAVNPLAHHRDPRDVTPIGMLVQVKDGRWIMHSLSEPHFFPAWITVIGFEWIWEDERFKGAPHQFPDRETKDELLVLLEQRMGEKTSTEWMELYLANGNVCAEVIQTTQDALRHPQVVATGVTVELDDPRVGRVLEVGPIAKISGAPAEVRRPAPQPGEHTDEVLGRDVVPVSVPKPTRAELAGPLDGITIVEAAYYYATPFATALLAELGARVIKIEPTYGDPYRLLARSSTGDPLTNLGQNNMVRAMQGKESIAIDHKDERGQEIVRQLVAQADVFVHSFRGNVPKALGIDYESLRAINSQLVYHYASAYGSDGPYARQPAIDPVVAAFTGQTAHQTGDGNPPLRESGADPVGAAGHAAAMMLGLFARHRTGEGQQVESAMIVSNLYLNCEDALSYEGKASRPVVDRAQLGEGATHRVFETAPVGSSESIAPYANHNPHWVSLAAERDDEFARFCKVAGRDDLANDPRFATASAREEHRAELERLLEEVFRTRTAQEWETALLDAGVGCVRADAMSHFAFLYKDEQAQAIGMMVRADHPSFGGPYWRYAPVIDFSDTPSLATRYCDFGEHTRAILRELGYDDDAMTKLRDDNVIVMAENEELASNPS
jgi:crotonobetainyl-CoA:carnitine CoA-transferase CaiB-like acyl-CoA transferase